MPVISAAGMMLPACRICGWVGAFSRSGEAVRRSDARSRNARRLSVDCAGAAAFGPGASLAGGSASEAAAPPPSALQRTPGPAARIPATVQAVAALHAFLLGALPGGANVI